MIPKPRNTLVLVELIVKEERKHGALVIPTNNEMYCEARVVAVGPGNINAAGARTETHDLIPGQHVLVKHQEVKPMGNQLMKRGLGIEYQMDGKTYSMFEQTAILAILSEATDAIEHKLDLILGNGDGK